MTKTQELLELMQANPEREVIFMYPEEGCDHPYTLGRPGKIIVDEYWTDEERVWFRHEDQDEMNDHFGEFFFDELYPNAKRANEEQHQLIDKKTKSFLESQPWRKCICVYIQPK